jgi:hypothetical protein
MANAGLIIGMLFLFLFLVGGGITAGLYFGNVTPRTSPSPGPSPGNQNPSCPSGTVRTQNGGCCPTTSPALMSDNITCCPNTTDTVQSGQCIHQGYSLMSDGVTQCITGQDLVTPASGTTAGTCAPHVTILAPATISQVNVGPGFCSANRYWDGSTCAACPAGQTSDGGLKCTPCPAGQTSVSGGPCAIPVATVVGYTKNANKIPSFPMDRAVGPRTFGTVDTCESICTSTSGCAGFYRVSSCVDTDANCECAMVNSAPFDSLVANNTDTYIKN